MKLNKFLPLLIACTTLSAVACDKIVQDPVIKDYSWMPVYNYSTSYETDDWVSCKSLVIDEYSFYASSAYELIGEYKSLGRINGVSSEEADADGFYHTYIGAGYGEGEKPTLPETGTLKYNYNKDECDVILVKEIGSYSNITNFYYSAKKKKVKRETLIYHPVDVVESDDINGKTFYATYINLNGAFPIFSDYVASKDVRVIEKREEISYLDVAYAKDLKFIAK